MQVITSKPFQILSPFGSKVEASPRGPQWPKQELVKYAVFLAYCFNISDMCQENDFKSWSFFRRLSIFVQTKNPNQCRIYHRKMMSDHASINSLVTQLKGSTHKFQEWYTHYQPSLNNLRINLIREKDNSQRVGNEKLSHQVQLHSMEENTQLRDQTDDKKLQELGPTDVGYNQPEVAPRSSSYVPLGKERPSFSLFTMDDQAGEINSDLTFFGKKREASLMEMVPGRKIMNQQERDEKWRECQSSFMDYMSKLNALMGVQ